jgi:hypothetical protein
MKMKKKMSGMIGGTTASRHFDDKIGDLMVKLLNRSYPVIKIKENKRFKRGVMIDGMKYLIPRDNLAIFGELYSTLKLFYNADDDDIVYVLTKYYNLST